ncbi:MAG TPA: trypsin-like serine protease [Polyangiaceae bacterium]|nr:trypsin-like serine protease [Polyangiaceae bacterium]
MRKQARGGSSWVGAAALAVLASWAALALAGVGVAGCGGRVGFVNLERPGLSGTGTVAPTAAVEDPDADEPEGAEPEHPLVSTKQERAMVHVHAGDVTCAGVVLGPRLVGTSRRCFKQDVGVHALDPGKKADQVRVEIASGSLAWAQRKASHIVIPACKRREVDLAVLVLSEAAAWVEPLELASAPGPDAKVDALGFDRCDGGKEVKRARVIEREDGRLTLDRAPCAGDIGAPVVETSSGRLIGIQSHRRGRAASPRRETAVTRLDTTPVKELLEQAGKVAAGVDVATLKPVACAASAP